MEKRASKNYIAEIIVFATGASVMILEIVGVRIVAPHLGTTIAVWSSLIGVILAGIGLGYYLGGVLADRQQSGLLLALILGAAGSLVLFIQTLRGSILSAAALNFSYGLGAFLGAFILFLPPTILLGMANTYTIRLKVRDKSTVGSVNGWLYGISTAGSIMGVFLTSLILLPRYSVSTILISLGITLFISAFLGLFVIPRVGRT